MGYFDTLALTQTLASAAAQRQHLKDALSIDFSVSPNEEHVTLQVRTQGSALVLGARAHHASLLALARLRQRDAERGLDPMRQGWIETGLLAHSLGLDVSHLNIHIFRARSQFQQLTVHMGLSVDLVQRRRGKLRFGSVAFQILRGADMEGELRADAAMVAPQAAALASHAGEVEFAL